MICEGNADGGVQDARARGASVFSKVVVEILNCSVLSKDGYFELNREKHIRAVYPKAMTRFQKHILHNERPIPKGSPAKTLRNEYGPLWAEQPGGARFELGPVLCMNDMLQAQASVPMDPQKDTQSLIEALKNAEMSVLDHRFYLLCCGLDPEVWGDREDGPSTQQCKALYRILRDARQ